MNRLSRVLVVVCTVLFVGVGVASADTIPGELTFTLTGPVTATFELPSQFPAGSGFMGASGFAVVIPSMVLAGFGTGGVNLIINGSPSADFLVFYNAAGGFHGGFAASLTGMSTDIFLVGTEQQIYTGPETAPMFSAGTFKFSDGSILTISGGPAVGTPEPSATILLGIGLLALGLTVLGYKRGFASTAS
jgi:hypothetical protein